MTSREEVLEALDEVIDPELGQSVVKMNLIRDIQIDGGIVHLKTTLTTPFCPLAGYLLSTIRNRVEELEGVEEAIVELVWDQEGRENLSLR
ncbi:MAG: metal-sulfur cluster assembly factor [Bacteroidota bacterium]